MEQILIRALDLGGTLTISLVVLWFGGKKIDRIEVAINKLLRLTALGFSSKGKKKEVSEIINGE